MALSADGKRLLISRRDSGWRNARLTTVASPVKGDVERLVLWAQVLADRELDPEGGVQRLDAIEWNRRLDRLNQVGGPPIP
jgi:hypothetical protein